MFREMYLDEFVPNVAFADLESEKLWDEACSMAGNPIQNWNRL